MYGYGCYSALFWRGGVTSADKALPINSFLASILVVICRCAVNCFYMNSGYFFDTDPNTVSIEKSFRSVKNLYKQVWTYSVLVYVVAIALQIDTFSVSNFLRAIFPIMGNQWWFVTVFMLIALLRPYLNHMTSRLSDRDFAILLVIMLAFDSVQSCFGVNVFNEFGNGSLHAVTMVLLGVAIRRYERLRIAPIKAILLYIIASVILRASALIVNAIPDCPIDYWSNLMVYNSPLLVIMGYGFFTFFAGLNIRAGFFSNISGSILAIYLIQDHSSMREKLWEKVFHCSQYYESNFMWAHWLMSVVIIMVGSLIIDILLKKIMALVKKSLMLRQ